MDWFQVLISSKVTCNDSFSCDWCVSVFVSVNGPKRLESAFAVTQLTSHNSSNGARSDPRTEHLHITFFNTLLLISRKYIIKSCDAINSFNILIIHFFLKYFYSLILYFKILTRNSTFPPQISNIRVFFHTL